MKKLSINTLVKVNGEANQYPFERICDNGIVLENTGRGYLVQLFNLRENLRFPRAALTLDK